MKMRKMPVFMLVTMCMMLSCILGLTGKQSFAQEKVKSGIKKVGGFLLTYDEIDKNSCWIYKIAITDGSKAKTLRIPAKIDGMNVTKIGKKMDSSDYGEENVFEVRPSDEDGVFIPVETYRKMNQIKTIIIPDTVKVISPHCFSYMSGGKTIHIPAKLTKHLELLCNIQWGQFKVAEKNPKFKVKNGLLLSKDGKIVYGPVCAGKKICIPNGVRKIKKNAFADKKISTIRIPSSVCAIGVNAFDNYRSVTFHVSKKNRRYKYKQNCIYSKKSGRLVAASVKKETLKIPDCVTCLKYGTSFCGSRVRTVIIPASVKLLGEGWDANIGEDEYYAYFQGKTVPKLEISSLRCYTAYVPKQSYALYKKKIEKISKLVYVKAKK